MEPVNAKILRMSVTGEKAARRLIIYPIGFKFFATGVR